MKGFRFLVFGIAAFGVVVAAIPQEPKSKTADGESATLSSLKLEFDVQRAELMKPIREFQKKYDQELQKLMDQVSGEGDLEKTLAVKVELEGYRDGKTVPAGDTFPDLKRLQEIFAETSAEKRETMSRQLSPVIEAYQSNLLALQKRLTQEGKLDEALAVKEEAANVNELALAAVSSGSLESSLMRGAARGKPFTNSLGMQFVPISISGNSGGGAPVLFSVWETRVSDYGAFSKKTSRKWGSPDFKQADDHPAVMVGWDDAKAFCQWLTEKERKEGVIEPGFQYRLPTDHEWSCAAGLGAEEDPDLSPLGKTGKNTEHFPWEKKWPPPKGSGNYFGEETLKDPVAGRKALAGYDDGYSRTSPAGAFSPNRFGLYDVGGNVWEWCEDWFDPASEKLRVLRGGSWINGDEPSLITSHRVRNPPGTRISNNGFRCVLVEGED